jgi:hypothetical protein
VELGGAGGIVGLHIGDAGRPVDLAFVADEPLEAVRDRLAAAGFPAEILDEDFGRCLYVSDPDGLAVRVNEHDEALYT